MKIYSNTGGGLNSKFTDFDVPNTGYGSMLYSVDDTFDLTIQDTYVECVSSYSPTTAKANIYTA